MFDPACFVMLRSMTPLTSPTAPSRASVHPTPTDHNGRAGGGLLALGEALTIVEAVSAAERTGLLDQLGEPITLDDLVGVDRDAAELVLEALEYVGVVTDVDGRWHRNLEISQLRWFKESHRAITDLLRSGRAPRNVADPAEAGPTYADVVDLLAQMMTPFTEELVNHIRVPGPSVLELASGSAVWSRALAEVEPGITLTVVDLPAVIHRTEAAIAEAGLVSRTTVRAGDLFTVDLDDTFDVVVVPGICRLLGPDANSRLFARAAEWCVPGGTVAVIDAFDTRQARQAGLALYRLGLATRTRQGRPWAPDHYADWLTRAGFSDINISWTDQPTVALLQATRNED